MRFIVYTAVSAASPQKDSGQVDEISSARTVSRICICFLSARPFCCDVPGHEY